MVAERERSERERSETGERSAYVLAGEGWHKGVIGIVASRIAERHHRPTVLIALEPHAAGGRGTGSGRSIPGFDLLAGLNACAEQLVRHGGHRAAAGCEILAADVDAFRDAFEAHATATLRPEDLVASERVDAVAAGDELGIALAEELELLAPFGIGNPGVSLLVPAARFGDLRTMGEGKHARFSVQSGGARAGAVAFGVSKVDCDTPLDATFSLELNEYNGSVEPRLVLRGARAPAPLPITIVGEPEEYLGAVFDELDRPLDSGAPQVTGITPVRDRRGGAVAGTIGALVGCGTPVLVVAADAHRRARHLASILGGFELCSHEALERDPSLAGPRTHVVMLDPPAGPVRAYGTMTHLAWGPAELAFAEQVHEHRHELRAALADTYRALRAVQTAEGEALEALLRGDAEASRPALQAGRLLRVLAELELVSIDRQAGSLSVPRAERTALEHSAAFRAYHQAYEDGRRWLSAQTAKAA